MNEIGTSFCIKVSRLIENPLWEVVRDNVGIAPRVMIKNSILDEGMIVMGTEIAFPVKFHVGGYNIC